MAVKASVTVTISCYRDTDTITRYYKLQASTAQTPAKPSTLIPSGWDDTEPTYTSGSTNTLYFVDRYVFSDGTFQYTEVSKSTSYEAAKEAYNKALNAQSTANSVDNKVKKLSGDPSNYSQLNDDTAYIWGFTHDDTADGHWYTENPLARDKFISDYYDCMGGEKYLINFEISTSCKANRNNSNTDLNIGYVGTAIGLYYFNDQNVSQGITYSQRTFGSEEAPVSIISSIVTVPDNARKFRVFVQTEAWNNFSGVIKVRNIRVKKLLVQSSDVEYYLSTSSSSVTGGSWSTNAPEWVDGKYMWSRTKTTYQNGAVTYTPSENGTCIAGAKGSTGTGIDSVTEEYYLSTSKTSQTGGSWSITPPTWSSGKYIWTRSKIVYKNPTSTSYTTPVCSSEWEAINYLEIGGRNYLTKKRELKFIKCSTPVSYEYDSQSRIFTITTSNEPVVWGEGIKNNNYYGSGDQIQLPYGKTLCISFEIKVSDLCYWNADVNCFPIGDTAWNGNDNDNLSLRTIGGEAAINNGSQNAKYIDKVNEWVKCYLTYTNSDSRNINKVDLYDNTSIGVNTPNITYQIKNIKYEYGNKPTDWSPAPEDAINDVTDYIDQNVDTLQRQIDGAIQFWNGSSIPTLNNYPASNWTTEADKNNHIADIYTIIQDVQGELKQGKGYRFDKVNNNWVWVEITDNELSAVQTLASSKAKVYVSTPTVPYSIGDLWLKDNKLYKCKTAKDSNGSYSLSDWELATDYTNDSKALEVQEKLNNLEIGGRNLLLNTNFSKNDISKYSGGNSTLSIVDDTTYGKCLKVIFSQSERFYYNTKNVWIQGQKYGISFMMRTNDDGVTVRPSRSIADYADNTMNVTSSWQKYTGIINCTQTADTGTLSFSINKACTVYITLIKLEKGNKCTDWSPAPEDLDNKIDNIEKRNMYIIKNSSEGYLQANGTTGLGHMDSINKEHTSEYIEVNQGETWIFQVWVTPTKASGRYLWMAYQLYDNNKSLYNTRQAYSIGDNTGTPQYYYYTINIPSGVKYIRVSARMYNDGRIKLEKNTIPTGWSLAPEDIDDKISEINKSVSEVVVGTQTTTTASWTGVASFDTLEDKQQITYWLPQTSANDVTLNLTLAGGTTTGAKPVYYSGTTRLGTHYPAGNAIRLTYRKNVTIGSTTITDGWWADANYNTNDNTYDRIRFNKPIKVKSAINAGELIVSDSNGYFKLTAGCSFNLDIPILMCATSKSAGATDSTNNYLSTPDGNIRYNTNNSWNATQYKTLYLVGDIVGNIFIVDSTTPFTTTIPTTDNNKYYISLGYMHTTYQMYLYPEHPIFKYVNGQFKNISQIAYEAFTSEIGGRNLLIGSKKYNKSTPFKINNTVTNDSYLFNYFMKLTPIPNEYYVIQVKSDIPLASSHGYNTANIGKFTFWLYIRNTGTTKVWGDFDNAQMFCSNDNSDNKRYLGSRNNTYYWLYKIPSNTQDVGVRVNTYADSEHPITANFWDFKIEKGNKATDWTSPPEDEYFNDNILLKTKDMITRIGNDIINYRNSVTEDTSRLFAPNNEEICKIFKSGGAWADIGSDLKYYIQKKILNLNDIVTYSIYASTDDTSPRSLSFFCGRGSNFYYQGAPTSIRGNTLRNNFGWIRYSYTFRITQTMINDASTYPNQELACRIESNAACTEGTYVYWSAPKLEFGEYVTDWAESPEDLKNTVEEVSKYAQDTASKLLLLDNEQGTGKVNSAISRINSLEGTITNLVKDDKGMVSMTQTGSGIKLDMTPITKNINELLDAIKGVATSGDLKGLSDELKKQLQELTDRTAYINASTDNQGRPVITLGATNSPFKVEITNEAINFIQNGQIIAYANGQKFYNLRTVVQQDVQIGVGPGFIWKTRESGNMGLTWVSGS